MSIDVDKWEQVIGNLIKIALTILVGAFIAVNIVPALVFILGSLR